MFEMLSALECKMMLASQVKVYGKVRGKSWLFLLVIGFKTVNQNQKNFGKPFTMFYLSSYGIFAEVFFHL